MPAVIYAVPLVPGHHAAKGTAENPRRCLHLQTESTSSFRVSYHERVNTLVSLESDEKPY